MHPSGSGNEAPLEQFFDKALDLAAAAVDPRQRLSLQWQLTALAAAVIFWGLTVERHGRTGAAGLIKWLLPRDVLLHPSAVADYFYFVCNRLLRIMVYAQIFVLVPVIHHFVFHWLLDTFGYPAWPRGPSWLWTIVVTLIIAMVMDAALWFVHWVFHVVPELWEFHKVHHSAEVLTPLTAGRMHPVEEIFDSIVVSLVVGVCYAVLSYWLGPATIEFTVLEMNVVLAMFFIAAFNLRHSHVFLRYPAWLQRVFISPAMHQIHHSRAPEHWDRNMGFIFSFWDRAAGTLISPKKHLDLEFGLGTREDGTWHGVGTLYLRPFRGAWGRFRGRFGGRQPEQGVDSKPQV